MELVTPGLGLIFWTSVVFLLLIFLLKKFAWSPILKAVDDRNNSINEALSSAEKAKSDMEKLSADNKKILNEARDQRDSILKEAREIKEQTISEARNQALIESDKIISAAKQEIKNQKMKAMTELKNEVADIAIKMAEKVIKTELKDVDSQKKLIEENLKESN